MTIITNLRCPDHGSYTGHRAVNGNVKDRCPHCSYRPSRAHAPT